MGSRLQIQVPDFQITEIQGTEEQVAQDPEDANGRCGKPPAVLTNTLQGGGTGEGKKYSSKET